jgi:hypothetical protein
METKMAKRFFYLPFAVFVFLCKEAYFPYASHLQIWNVIPMKFCPPIPHYELKLGYGIRRLNRRMHARQIEGGIVAWRIQKKVSVINLDNWLHPCSPIAWRI